MARPRRLRDGTDFDPVVLSGLSGHDLRSTWARLYGFPPARSLGRDILRRGVAYVQQERTCDRREIQQLRKRVAGLSRCLGTDRIPTPQTMVKPGARLLREWQGQVHEVTVTDKGYFWKGSHHRSLSAIARTITGTAWNGPAFFGLRQRKSRDDPA